MELPLIDLHEQWPLTQNQTQQPITILSSFKCAGYVSSFDIHEITKTALAQWFSESSCFQ